MRRRTVVKRSKWLRGEGVENSCLLHTVTGKMCCLGFDALASGLTHKKIKGKPDPGHVDLVRTKWGKEWPSGIFNDERVLLHRAVKWNDDPDVTDEERERELTRVFAENGIELTFED